MEARRAPCTALRGDQRPALTRYATLVLIPIPAMKVAITTTWVERATRPAPSGPSMRETVMLFRPRAAKEAISPAEASIAPTPNSRAGARGASSRRSATVTESFNPVAL